MLQPLSVFNQKLPNLLLCKPLHLQHHLVDEHSMLAIAMNKKKILRMVIPLYDKKNVIDNIPLTTWFTTTLVCIFARATSTRRYQSYTPT